MTILTVYVLFADDIKMIATGIYADDIFSAVCLAIMVLFAIELTISCYCLDNYILSFYFWLDFVSLISMLLDISWFYTALITNLSGGTNAKSIAAIAKAGRGAKVGSRAVRILRVLRIIRLVRISKLYKARENYIQLSLNEKKIEQEKQNMAKKKQENNDRKDGESSDDENEDPSSNNQNVVVPAESKIGKKLSDLTTRKVIVLVLSMLIGIILLNTSFFFTNMTTMDFGIKIFDKFNTINDKKFNMTFNIYIMEHLNINTPIIWTQISNYSYGEYNDTLILRDDEKIISQADCLSLQDEFNQTYPDKLDNFACMAIFDNRASSKLSAILNIIKTIFICIVLAFGSLCFSKDTTELVLEPIENMTLRVKQIAKNPIEAIHNIEKEDYLKQMIDKETERKRLCKTKKTDKAPLETVVLEKTISKIGGLLALGFGEAGSEIIAKNMSKHSKGEVNPMIAGKKVMAIYGFCDIRNFTDTTEVLQEEVMIFVNEIAQIVHEITIDHFGAANKNIGDAFLLVWKIENKFVEIDQEGNLFLSKCNAVNQMVDMSVIAFLKIIAKVYKSYKLDKYRKNELLNERILNYAVKMGFGLHLGYSIEGAIGSSFKIDASYLSPNVNEASKLEEKTKEYGVQLIISQDLVENMSEDCRSIVRVLDVLAGGKSKNKLI